MAYVVLSEVQTQETDLGGDQVDVMAVRANSPVTLPSGVVVTRVVEVRVPLAPGWDQTAIGYLDQRIAEMDAVKPATSIPVGFDQGQEVGPAGNLVDVMHVTFETVPEAFVGAVTVPIAGGWDAVAVQQIDALTVEMQNVVAGG